MKKLILLILISVAVYGIESEKVIDTETWCRAYLNIIAPPIHYTTTFVEKTSDEIFVPIPPNYANYPKPYCTNLDCTNLALALQSGLILSIIKKSNEIK